MKLAILAVLLLGLSACTTSTPKGACVGLLDQKNPKVGYELSIWNIALGVIFSETVIVPAVVVLKALECPIR